MKNRWTFEGKDRDGKVVFPRSFVMASDPDEKKDKISIKQFFPMPNDEKEFVGGVDRFNDLICYVASGSLICWDQWGNQVKEWILHDVKARLSTEFDIDDDRIIAEWLISYTNFDLIES